MAAIAILGPVITASFAESTAPKDQPICSLKSVIDIAGLCILEVCSYVRHFHSQ
jgi:hypothetical protein